MTRWVCSSSVRRWAGARRTRSSTQFYEGLQEVSGWQSWSVAQAAQAVQQSGFPGAYAKWEPLATALQKAIKPVLPKAGDTSPSPSPSGSAGPGGPSPGTAGGCAADGDGTRRRTGPARPGGWRAGR